MEILKGTAVVAAMNEKMKQELAVLGEKAARVPKLAIVRVGERPDDLSYEKGATKRMATVGIDCETFAFPADISNEEFQQAFCRINTNESIDGILVLRPLPRHLDETWVTENIAPEKDVDCISPVNMAKLFMGDTNGYAPCTAQAVVEMLEYMGMPLAGKEAVIIGRSMVVGKPLAMLLLQKNCTVTVCHTKTVDMPAVCRRAEIVIAAAGCAGMVTRDYISPKIEAVMDVGINYDEKLQKLRGDVDTEDVLLAAADKDAENSIITPVPGGVGTVTTSVLAQHVIQAYCRKQ